jgi:hypothetical protein
LLSGYYRTLRFSQTAELGQIVVRGAQATH